MQYSNLANMQVLVGATRPAPTDIQGRVRMASFNLTVGAADTSGILVKMPSGTVRILKADLKATLATGATTLAIGTSAYNDLNNASVAAAPAGLQAAVASTSLSGLAAVPAEGVVISSIKGFDVTVTSSASMAVNDVIRGTLYYVVD